MPSVSRSQRIATAVALHHPEKLNPANRGLLRMSKSSLRDFAETPEKGLPKHSKGGIHALASAMRKRGR